MSKLLEKVMIPIFFLLLFTTCACSKTNTDIIPATPSITEARQPAAEPSSTVTVTAAPTAPPTLTPTATPSPTPVIKNWEPLNEEETVFKLLVDTSLFQQDCYVTLLPYKDNLLVLSRHNNTLSICLVDYYSGKTVKETDIINDSIDMNKAKVHTNGQIELYDYLSHTYLLFDSSLRIVNKIPCPVENEASYLTDDFSCLYYFDSTQNEGISLVRYDLNDKSSISTPVAYEINSCPQITALLFNETLLMTEGYNGTRSVVNFYDSKDLSLKNSTTTFLCSLTSYKDTFAGNYSSLRNMLLYGSLSDPENLKTVSVSNNQEADNYHFFLSDNRLCTITSTTGEGPYTITPSFYDLTGKEDILSTTLTDPKIYYLDAPVLYNKKDNFLIGRASTEDFSYIIYLWDLTAKNNQSEKKENCLCTFLDPRNIKPENFHPLQYKADEISEKYDVSVVLLDQYSYALTNYDTEPLFPDVSYEPALDQLSCALSRYPEGFFRQLTNHTEPLTFYLTGTLTGINSYSLSTAGGVYDNTNIPYIAIDCNYGYIESTVYHEISHAIDNYLLCVAADFDYQTKWEEANPEGFTYSYAYNDYGSNSDLNCYYASDFTPDDVYFIDSYSKVNSNEDRARTMEYILFLGIDTFNDCPHLLHKFRIYYDAIMKGFDTSTWTDGFLSLKESMK